MQEYGNCATECRFVVHKRQADIFSFSGILGVRIKKAILGSKFGVNLPCLSAVLIYQLITLSPCQASHFYCFNKFTI